MDKRNSVLLVVFLLQLIVSGMAACLMGAVYAFRYTYVRSVAFAKDSGKDPYWLAREGVDQLAHNLFLPGFIMACITGGIALVFIAQCWFGGNRPCSQETSSDQEVGGAP